MICKIPKRWQKLCLIKIKKQWRQDVFKKLLLNIEESFVNHA